jgi:NAD(P)-dependent dehydrogenase (short-subunit alcohol dehydrogenase family)
MSRENTVSTPSNRTALIVGASRGLGLALAKECLTRGWHVIATVRGTEHGGLHGLLAEYEGRLEIEKVDINDTAQVQALHARLRRRSLDLLFVNAGIAPNPDTPIGEVSTDEFVSVMVNNALSPMRFIETFHDRVQAKGTIAVMSSGLGSVANNTNGGWETYRASKASLNTLLRSFVARHATDERTYLLIAPGWVRTDMGGPEATLSIEESIPRVVDVVEWQIGKGGLHYLNYQGETLAW